MEFDSGTHHLDLEKNKVRFVLPAKLVFITTAVSGITVQIPKFFARARPKLWLEEGIYGFDFFTGVTAMLLFHQDTRPRPWELHLLWRFVFHT